MRFFEGYVGFALSQGLYGKFLAEINEPCAMRKRYMQNVHFGPNDHFGPIMAFRRPPQGVWPWPIVLRGSADYF